MTTEPEKEGSSLGDTILVLVITAGIYLLWRRLAVGLDNLGVLKYETTMLIGWTVTVTLLWAFTYVSISALWKVGAIQLILGGLFIDVPVLFAKALWQTIVLVLTM